MTQAEELPSRLSPEASIDYTNEGWVGVNPSGKAYSFGTALAAYASALATARTREDIRTQLQTDTGLEWSDSDLAVAHEQLGRLGFLGDRIGASESRKRWIRYVPPLTVQLTLVNPERLFSALEQTLGRAKPKLVFVVAAISALVGISIFIVDRDAVLASVSEPLALVDYMALLLLMFVATALHEAGHAAALARLGGRPKRVGVMLFYLMPAFFCDVSDAWRVGNRRQRAMVAASGVLVQVTLAGLAVFASILLPDESPAARVLAAFAVLSFLTAMVNAIPFVKFDGYIALMAITGHNFLRHDAINEGRRLLARVFLSRRVTFDFPDSRWIRWYGLGCIIFPGYLVASAMWLWLGELKVLGLVGSVIGVVAVVAFVAATLRELVEVARIAVSAGGNRAAPWGAAMLLAGAVIATGALVQVPTVTLGGYIADGKTVRLVLPVGTSPADLDRQLNVILRSNGLLLHQGAVKAQIAQRPVFHEQTVPLAAIAPIDTSLLEVHAQTTTVCVEGGSSALAALNPTGQAVITGTPHPLWQVVWRTFF